MAKNIPEEEPQKGCLCCDEYLMYSIAALNSWAFLKVLLERPGLPKEIKEEISDHLWWLENIPQSLSSLDDEMEQEFRLQMKKRKNREVLAAKMEFQQIGSIKEFLSQDKKFLLPIAGKKFSY